VFGPSVKLEPCFFVPKHMSMFGINGDYRSIQIRDIRRSFTYTLGASVVKLDTPCGCPWDEKDRSDCRP
jgi:hypothetical protein